MVSFSALRVAAFASVVALASARAWADTAVYSPDRAPHAIPRVDSAIRVDGVLDEAPWEDALTMTLAYEQRPAENAPASVETDVLLMHSDSHVYAAFRAHDPDPGQISAHYTDRDGMYDDDWVLLVLDTFNSEREAYNFCCNPLGVQGDTYESPAGESDAWDAIWESAGRVTDFGYVVEMAIPLSSLRFQRAAGEQVWGFDAARHYPRSVTRRFGIFPVDRDRSCYTCQYQKLTGFEGATPGRNVEMSPTFTATRTEEREGWTEGSFEETDSAYEPGLTARWGITPNMALVGAANPDFSQVEADAWQLAVNERFALSYLEKRPFFLEGAEIFNDRLTSVYTRSVADPSWGAKLAGRAGPGLVGAFLARDEITNLMFPGLEGSASTSLDMQTTAAALRYRHDIGQTSTVGVIATDREGDGYTNRVAGFDGTFHFLKSERVSFQALGSWTEYPDKVTAAFGQPEGEFRGFGFDGEYFHDSDHVYWFVHQRYVDEGLRLDVGFRPQVGTKHVCGEAAYWWHGSADDWFTEIGASLHGSRNLDMNGDLQSESVTIGLGYDGPLQTAVRVHPQVWTEVYDGREYDLAGTNVYAEMRPVSAVEVAVEGYMGELVDYDNNRQARGLNLTPSIELRLGRHLSAELEHSYERLDVTGGWLYTANATYLKAVYQFGRRAFLRAIVQHVGYEFNPALYDEEVGEEYRDLGSQVLFSYEMNPRTVFYLGYSDGFHGDENVDLTQTDRTVFAKVGYAWVL